MNDQQIEKEIVEKGKTAPRITPQHIEDVIKSEHYFTAYDGRNGAISSNEYSTIEVAHFLRIGTEEWLHRYRRECLCKPGKL